jgi:hypothetical protein
MKKTSEKISLARRYTNCKGGLFFPNDFKRRNFAWPI